MAVGGVGPPSQRPWIVWSGVETHEAVVLPMDETLTWTGVVVDHPADTERIDVAEAAFPGRASGVGFLVVLPGQIVSEAIVRHRNAIVDVIGAAVRLMVPLLLVVVERGFQEITVEGWLGFQVVVRERDNQRLWSGSRSLEEGSCRCDVDRFHVDGTSSVLWDSSSVMSGSGDHLDELMPWRQKVVTELLDGVFWSWSRIIVVVRSFRMDVVDY